MEFPFDVNRILKKRITKITNTLLPDDFTGDRRSAWDCTGKISEILDEMGKLSAKAQGLQKPITSSDRLRNVDHIVYLLTDPESNKGKGSVVGLLKVGRKKLYVFDASGEHHEMEPLCVLDFYVHESKQRMGCGKLLYEHMLKEEHITPVHLAIDRPSEKFLAFLFKHYGLEKILPQTNNYVIFDGFFKNQPTKNLSISDRYPYGRASTSCVPNNLEHLKNATNSPSSENQTGQLYGRFAARRPPATIGKILQHTAVSTHQRSGTC